MLGRSMKALIERAGGRRQRRRAARPRGRGRSGAARRSSQSMRPAGSGLSPDGATSTARPEPLRTSSSTTEPWRSSNQRERRDLPTTTRVTLRERAKARISSTTERPGTRTTSAPSCSASRSVSASRACSASRQQRRGGRSRHRARSARHRDRRPCAWRRAPVLAASGPGSTQTSTRSPAPHGPVMACARM